MPTGHIALLTTGGTIAGRGAHAGNASDYVAGSMSATDLLTALGHPDDLPRVETQELLSIDSKDMTPEHWLMIARAVEAARASASCQGVVITHGTDTLEETAWFLHLVCSPGKPVVLTAAMRPATALSADGPMNLYQALCVAALPAARGHGVLVVMNDQILAASDIVKTHTHALDAIAAPRMGTIGDASERTFCRPPALGSAGCVPLATLQDGATLPEVDILHVAAGSRPALLAEAHERGCAGVILALPGNGSLPDTWRDAALAAVDNGVRVIRASRVANGSVSTRAATILPGSGVLNPLQARIALMLELTTGTSGLFARLAAGHG